MSVALESMSAFARHTVDTLGLEPHPEGGWYTRDWQSPHTDTASGRPLASMIYFLLPAGDASAWHKVDADEMWLWHGPDALTIQLGGTGETPNVNETDDVVLGAGIAATAENAETVCAHLMIPAGTWQRTIPSDGDVLVSCVVSPGFVFSGFTLEDSSDVAVLQH